MRNLYIYILFWLNFEWKGHFFLCYKGSNSYIYVKNHIILESSQKCANGVLTALVYMIIDPYVKLCNLAMAILHF